MGHQCLAPRKQCCHTGLANLVREKAKVPSTLPLSLGRFELRGLARRPLEPRLVIWCFQACSLRFSAQGLKQLLSPSPAPPP